jgi:hypothetical protein
MASRKEDPPEFIVQISLADFGISDRNLNAALDLLLVCQRR